MGCDIALTYEQNPSCRSNGVPHIYYILPKTEKNGDTCAVAATIKEREVLARYFSLKSGLLLYRFGYVMGEYSLITYPKRKAVEDGRSRPN